MYFLIGMSQASDVDFSSMTVHSLVIFSAVPRCVPFVLQRRLPLCTVPTRGLIGHSRGLSVEFCLTAMATGLLFKSSSAVRVVRVTPGEFNKYAVQRSSRKDYEVHA